MVTSTAAADIRATAGQRSVLGRDLGGVGHHQGIGQTQSVGTGDHEHGDHHRDGARIGTPEEDGPAHRSDGCRGQRGVKQKRCCPVGKQLGFRLAGLRLGNQCHNPL